MGIFFTGSNGKDSSRYDNRGLVYGIYMGVQEPSTIFNNHNGRENKTWLGNSRTNWMFVAGIELKLVDFPAAADCQRLPGLVNSHSLLTFSYGKSPFFINGHFQ